MYKRPRLTASPYFAEVSPKKRNPEGSTQLPVTWGLTYLCKEQHFQAFTLKSTDDRQGLVDVVGERVLNLTQEQRLTPVMIKFLPREPPQKVYLFCLVRSSKLCLYFLDFSLAFWSAIAGNLSSFQMFLSTD